MVVKAIFKEPDIRLIIPLTDKTRQDEEERRSNPSSRPELLEQTMGAPTATSPNGSAPAPARGGGDWRAQVLREERSRIVDSIMETLKKLVLVPVPERSVLESELQKIAQQYEEKIYTAAINESAYFRKITQQMHSMERWMKSQQKKNPVNAQVIQNQKPPGPAPGFPPRGSNPVSADGLSTPIPPSKSKKSKTISPMVAAPVLLPSPSRAPSSPTNSAGSISWGGVDANPYLGQFSADPPIEELLFDISVDWFNNLAFPVDAAAVLAGLTLPEQEATPVRTPPFIMVPTPPSAAPAPAAPASPYVI